MNPVQRLFSNTTLAFVSNIVVKLGSSVLFILIGRLLGPADAGIFNLGVTFFTILMALSDLGLQELFVREVAPRREESGRYLVNYLAMRTLLVVVGYGILFLLIYFLLPYQEETKTVILILGLAVLPEALFALFQALFVAHERLLVPTVAAVFNSGFKLGVGYWLLVSGYPVTTIVWVMPVGSTLSLLFLLPGLGQLFRLVPQVLPGRLNLSFSLGQLHYMPGFVLISTFLTLDFQLDAFLISLYLSETDIGWYGAAQTIVLGFWMMATAIRTTLYPVMARIQKEAPERLPTLYRRAHQYLLLAGLPIAAGITVLARPIVRLVFSEGFEETVPALQIMIWAVVFAFINVPNARLVLVRNRQKQAGWMTGISMGVNVVLNLVLIPQLGIVGAAAARTAATAVLFLQLYTYSQRYLEVASIVPLLGRPVLATMVMSAVIWPIRQLPLYWPIMAGIIVYGAAAYFLKAIPEDARERLGQLSVLKGR